MRTRFAVAQTESVALERTPHFAAPMAEEAEAAPDAAEARASPETQATAEQTALLVMQCAGCQLANEVSIPIGDQRVFAVQCCGCDALNEITIDTNGGPLVCSEGKAEWNKHVREVSASATADSVPADDPSPSPAAEAEESAASSVPLKKRQKLSTPKAEELPPTAASDGAPPKPMVVKLGSAVIAKFNDGYYYHGIVEDMQGSSRFFIAWDDGDPTSWVTARHTALFYRPACPSEVSVGMPVLALWRGITKVEGDDEEESDVFFPAKVMSRLPDGNFALKWLDGGENFRTGAEELRTFLSFSPGVRVAPDEKVTEDEEPTRKKLLQQQKEQDQKERRPTPPKLPPKVSRSEPEAQPGRSGFAADLVRRSGRGGAASEGRSSGADPSDTRLLSQAMAELHRCWAGVSPQGAWKVSQDVGGVPGLAVCADFLSAAEVEALRTLIGAHRTWEQYTYGSTGRHGELASVVQRIDFGPAEAAPEGAVGGSPMWRLGHERAELLQLVGDRLRHVFASSRLWVDTQPDTVRLTPRSLGQPAPAPAPAPCPQPQPSL